MKKLFCIVFLLFSLSAVSFGQYNSDFNITGAGARAEGFGGAFIGLADDATAVVWNPSGLTQLERPEASVVSRFISEGVAFKNENKPRFDYEESNGRFGLNFASFATPVTKNEMKIVAAVSFQRQLDFFEKGKNEEDIGGGNTIQEVTDATGGVNTITPAIALKINPMISLGLSVNIWTGSIDNKHSVQIIGFGKNREDYTADFSGLNFVFGALFDFEQMKNGVPFKIGATVRTPFNLTSKGSVVIEDQLSSTPGIVTVDVKQTIQMPLMIGLGVSYRLGENLTFAFDYEMRNYAQKNLTTDLSLANFGTISGTERVSQSGKNLNEIRFGGEYLIVGDAGVIPIRLGLKTVPTILSDVDIQYDPVEDDLVLTPNGNQVKGAGIALGSGFISNSFAIDVTISSQAYTQKVGANSQFDFTVGTLSSSVIIYF
ncbi:MAG: outer membrane protein transport protein [Bacteroidota bacterium]|nr:outer membrane protein transport protein [Bacteroidota bacterium]